MIGGIGLSKIKKINIDKNIAKDNIMIKKTVKKFLKWLFKPILQRYYLLVEKIDRNTNLFELTNQTQVEISQTQNAILAKFCELTDKSIIEISQTQSAILAKLCEVTDKSIIEISQTQSTILARFREITDKSIIDAHHSMYGIYKSSDRSKLKSSICRMQDLLDYNNWMKEIFPHLPESGYVMNRKMWEYVFIVQALYEREMLSKGKKGLGFAVGKEPLPSLFAKYGCEIVATDINSSSDTAQLWSITNQHSGSTDDLYKADICDRYTFEKNVSFRFLDMNAIQDDLEGFDFCWSSCAFEHLGSILKGKQFIYNMMKCLKPGGIAIHTTEYNLSSYNGVMVNSGCVIFGRSDFEEMRDTLIAQGHYCEDLDYRLGNYNEENYIAYHPYKRPHFKLYLGGEDEGCISTSFSLLIKKGNIS